MSENFKKFNQTIILTGYKSALVNKKYPKLKKIKNNKYLSTNMVYSLFCAKNYIKQLENHGPKNIKIVIVGNK